jgi:hypothetical protein
MGFGFDIVTSDIVGITIAVLITILFFVVMRNKGITSKRIVKTEIILKTWFKRAVIELYKSVKWVIKRGVMCYY